MKTKLKWMLPAALGLVFFVVFLQGYATAAGPTPKAASSGTAGNLQSAPGKAAVPDAAAFFPQTTYEFEPVVEGTRVIHEFRIQNRGSVPLKIEKVRTG